jgi:hypothetical protein
LGKIRDLVLGENKGSRTWGKISDILLYKLRFAKNIRSSYHIKVKEKLVSIMLRTFEALLKGKVLEWTNDAPQQSDRPLKVYVTLLEEKLEEKSSISAEIRRQKIVEILEKLAASQTFAEMADPVAWQREMRQDRPLPGRDE